MTIERKRLTDILRGSSRETIERAWAGTEAAGEMGPLPAGEYVAHIIAGELVTSRTNGTPGYSLTFKILEGDFVNRRFWHEIWLTPAALPMAKRDLLKIGVTSLDQLEKPLPPGIRCKARVAVRKNDDGEQRNVVKFIEVVGIDPPEVDPFAPSNNGGATP